MGWLSCMAVSHSCQRLYLGLSNNSFSTVRSAADDGGCIIWYPLDSTDPISQKAAGPIDPAAGQVLEMIVLEERKQLVCAVGQSVCVYSLPDHHSLQQIHWRSAAPGVELLHSTQLVHLRHTSWQGIATAVHSVC
jgi:hypothetical protein